MCFIKLTPIKSQDWNEADWVCDDVIVNVKNIKSISSESFKDETEWKKPGDSTSGCLLVQLYESVSVFAGDGSDPIRLQEFKALGNIYKLDYLKPLIVNQKQLDKELKEEREKCGY